MCVASARQRISHLIILSSSLQCELIDEFLGKMDQKAVQIISSNGEDCFSLNEDALSQILNHPKIKNKPVCVISIAGAFRQGKSFFLNFLLRYLNLKYIRAEDVTNFLDAEHGPLQGFSWKAGRERHTLGILMWSKIFLAEVKGKEVAIILLDTQGTFDNQSTYNNCATIFALSTLISSVQIYNLMQNVKQDDLNHLQCFAEYGKWVKSDDAPFQKLLFLVRDWRWPDDNDFGIKGGAKLLDDILDTSADLPVEIKAQRRNIKELFAKIDCFLMPKPGDAVSESKNFKGGLEDIDPKFLQYIEKLVPLILEPQNLNVKEINGETVTAGELFHYIKSYMDRFQNEDKPQMRSVYLAMVEANHMVAVDQAEQKFKDLIEDALGDANEPYLDDLHLDMTLLKAEYEAMTFYQRKEKLGSDRKIDDKYKKILEKKLRTITDEFKEINKIKRLNELARIKMEHEATLRTCVENYATKMEEIISSFPEDEELSNHHQSVEHETLKYFEDNTSSPKDVKTKYMNGLQREISAKFEDIKKKNKSARDNNLEMSKLKCENSAIRAMEMYKRSVDQINGACDDERFLKIHRESEKAAVEFFTNETKCCQGKIVQELLSQLQNQIRESQNYYSASNKKKLEYENTVVQLKLENLFTKSVEKYKKTMERNMKDMGCEEGELIERHNSAGEEIIKSFQSEAGDAGAIIDPFLQKLQAQINACFQDFHQTYIRKRDENISLSQLRHEYALKNTIEKYKEIIEVTLPRDESLNEDALTQIHEQCRASALKFYQGEMKNVVNEEWYQEFYNETKMKIDDASDEYFNNNARKIEAEQNRIRKQHEEFVRRALEKYTEIMESSVNAGGLMDNKELRKEHTDAREEAIEFFEQETEDSGQELRQQYSTVLDKKIKEFYKDYKNRNASNDDIEMPNSRMKHENAVSRAEDVYRQIMDKLALSNNYLDKALMRSQHESAKIQAVNTYENDTRSSKKHVQEEYLRTLETNLQGYYYEYVEQNDAKREKKNQDEEKLSKTLDASIMVYKQVMDQFFSNGNKYFKDDRLKKEHDSARKQATERFQELTGSVGNEDKGNLMKTLEERIRDNFDFYKTKNKQSKDFIALQGENKCLRALLSAQTMYRDMTEQMFQQIAQRGTAVNENLVNQALAEISKSVTAHYKEKSVKDEEINKKYLPELEQYVNKIRMFSVRQNQ